MLSEEEWDLLDKLVDILVPFEETTREFSGGTYVTLSKMMLTIKELIFNIATNSPSDDNNYLNENTIFEEAEATVDVEIDDEIISNITNKKISIKNPLNTEGVLEKVKSNIYHALLYYWDTPNIPNNAGLMASLLDPRYKELDFVELEDEKDKIIQKLRDEFNELKPNNSPLAAEQLDPTVPLSDADAESSMRSQKEYRQRRQSKTRKDKFNTHTVVIDEVSSYLAMPVALEAENPLDWWRVRAKIFPTLSQIARKYLEIPATSVSSERLFSHASNLISVKRTRLDTSLAGQMLFLKRNIRLMEVFPKEWDEIEE